MDADRTNIVICPSCGAENIEGVDTCENCMMDLRTLDVPETSQVESDSALLDTLGGLRIGKAATVTASATVREALAVLAAEPGGGLVVLDGAGVAGVFTERDVLKKIIGGEGRLDLPVREFMTPDPVVLRDSDTVQMALNKMGDGGFRHIPLVADGRLKGMVTGREVLGWIMGRYLD